MAKRFPVAGGEGIGVDAAGSYIHGSGAAENNLRALSCLFGTPFSQTMPKDKPKILLGPGWEAFAQEREGMHFVGTLQRGMQIGALATLPDGSYAQVNGDIVEPLNKSRIEHLLRSATGARRGEPLVHVRRPSTAVVTVKKKRRIVPPS